MNDSDLMVGEDLGTCPFCGGNIAKSSDPPSVMHSLPMCEKYVQLEGDDFLAEVAEARRQN